MSPIKFSIIVGLTQFTNSKTKRVLDYIQAKHNSVVQTGNEHCIDIFVCNKSLVEVKQAKERFSVKFGTEAIHTLSSRKDADFNNIQTYICHLLSPERDYLPNILIMCFHPKRVGDDLKTLVKFFNLEKKGNKIKDVVIKFRLYLIFEKNIIFKKIYG